MNLYLMRHAEAEKMGDDVLSDAERPLTAYGRSQAKTVAQELKRRMISPFIVTSPYLRTVQTAEILRVTLGLDSFHKDNALASVGHAPDLAALLRVYSQAQQLLLIGHQPDVGMLAAQLLGFEFGFGTAVVAAFEYQASNVWKFRWTFSPS